MHSLRERWRAYKYKLRCERFYPNKSKDEILANPPPNVDTNDWTAFVHHYKEDKMKDKISVHLHDDQDHAATSGVPLKIWLILMMPLEKSTELNILVVCVV